MRPFLRITAAVFRHLHAKAVGKCIHDGCAHAATGSATGNDNRIDIFPHQEGDQRRLKKHGRRVLAVREIRCIKNGGVHARAVMAIKKLIPHRLHFPVRHVFGAAVRRIAGRYRYAASPRGLEQQRRVVAGCMESRQATQSVLRVCKGSLPVNHENSWPTPPANIAGGVANLLVRVAH